MEELKAMFRVCAHIKKDGVRCNGPAMKGMNFCYQHIGGSIRELTRARSTYVGPKLDFVYPGCRQAIQHNFFVIAQAMNDGKIDLQTACAYNRIYSACERNLRRFETLYEKDAERELAPLPDETPESETSPTDAGAPFFRAVSSRERVGDEESQPSDNAGAPFKRSLSGEQTPADENPGAPCLEETWVRESTDNAGAPFKRSLSGEQTPADENLGAPRLDFETWEQAPEQQPTHRRHPERG